MKTYRVTVNEEVYEVTIEEVKVPTQSVAPPRTATPASTPVPTPSVSPPQATPKPAPPPPASAPTPIISTGGKEVQAPMPGKILAIKVVAGDVIKSGSVLIILEAMKMENDIMAPVDGTVKSVNVSVGDSVNTGDILVVIE